MEEDGANSNLHQIGIHEFSLTSHRRYDLSVPALTKDHKRKEAQYAVSNGRPIRRIQDVVCEYSGRYKGWSLLQETPIRHIQSLGYAVNLDNSTNNVLIPLDSWTSGLLVYKLPLSKLMVSRKVFNWETAKYGKIGYDEDVHDLRSVETEFPAIAFNNEVSSEKTVSCEPKVSSLNDEIDFRVSFDDSDDEDYTSNTAYPFTWIRHMALPPRDQRHQYLRYEGLQYTNADIADFEARLAKIYRREVHRVQIEISSARDFLGTTPSYTAIRDLILRLCHRLIACSIAGRSHTPEKICVEIDDTWDWVALGHERQPNTAAGAPGVAQDAPAIDEGAQADPAPMQAPPPPPPAAARTMT
ncbi:hypothetical protein Tco_0183432 [Tanacetum coccineum]